MQAGYPSGIFPISRNQDNNCLNHLSITIPFTLKYVIIVSFYFKTINFTNALTVNACS